MNFVDTHTHIYDDAFAEDRDAAVRRAVEAGVRTMLLPAIDSKSTQAQEALAKTYPDVFRQMAGLHPTSVDDNFEEELSLVQQQLSETGKYVAVGEIGMDLYWDRTYEQQQVSALERQMRWAIDLDLPVALHIRKAHNEVFGLMKRINRPTYRGVMHCFGGSVQEAMRAIEMGFHLGVGGVVTFKNSTLSEVVKAVPLESILLETDAPYLSPVPYRGKRNESAYIPIIAARVAELKDIPIEEVAEVTTCSAVSLFRL